MTWIFASAMAQTTTLCPVAVEQGWREVDGMLLGPDERIPLRVRSLVEPRQDARPVVSARLDLPQGTALDQVTVHVCRYRASDP